MRSSNLSRGLSAFLAGFLVLAVTPLWLPGSVVLSQSSGGQNSLSLNGSGAYAQAPHAAELNTTGDWTIEAWFKDETPGGYNHGRARIITKGDTGAQEVPYFIDIAGNQLFAGRRISGDSQVVSYDLGTNNVSHNTWHHVAASFNSTTFWLRLYLDGIEVAQVFVHSGTSLGNTSPVSIGRNGGGAVNLWLGKLDDVRIWNVVRSQIEINRNWLVELSGSPAGLVANWRFNESGGTTAADTAGIAQDATLSGGASFSDDTHFTAPLPPTPSPTPDVPVNTPTPSSTPPPTSTPLPTSTSTSTPLPTSTSTSTPLPTSTPTSTPLPTSTPTSTPLPTSTSTSTPLPTITTVPATATRTPTAVPSATSAAASVTPTTQSLGGFIIAPTAVPPAQPFFVPVYPQPVSPIGGSAPRRQPSSRPPASEPEVILPPTATSEPVLLPPPPDSRVRAVVVEPGPIVVSANAPDLVSGDPNEDWLVILRPVQTYGLEMGPLWMAEAGDWYRVSRTEAGYALAVWEFDTSEWAVWILLDETRVRRVRIDADHPRIVSRLWLTTNESLTAYSASWEPVDVGQGERYLVLWTDGSYILVTREDDTAVRLWIRLGAGIEITLAGAPH